MNSQAPGKAYPPWQRWLDEAKFAYIVKFFQVIISNGEHVQLGQRIHVFKTLYAIAKQRQILQLRQFVEAFNHLDVIERQVWTRQTQCWKLLVTLCDIQKR